MQISINLLKLLIIYIKYTKKRPKCGLQIVHISLLSACFYLLRLDNRGFIVLSASLHPISLSTSVGPVDCIRYFYVSIKEVYRASFFHMHKICTCLATALHVWPRIALDHRCIVGQCHCTVCAWLYHMHTLQLAHSTLFLWLCSFRCQYPREMTVFVKFLMTDWLCSNTKAWVAVAIGFASKTSSRMAKGLLNSHTRVLRYMHALLLYNWLDTRVHIVYCVSSPPVWWFN